MDDVRIVTPSEQEGLKLEVALQLLAVFIARAGGEVLISQEEFDEFEGMGILAHKITPQHLRLRLDEQCDCPDCNPQA